MILITQFFLIFSILFISFFIYKFSLNNLTKNYLSFNILFISSLHFSRIKKFYFKCFYEYLDYSKFTQYNEKKSLLKSIILVFNYEKNEFQVLVQYRPPLIFLIILSYLIVCFMNLAV
jgi:hypothetical protein